MRKLVAIVVALVATTAANAAPINYQESVSGDLPTFGTPLPTFNFDAGTNTISGRFGTLADGSADFDSFAFVVPSGMRLTSAKVQLVDAQGDLIQGGWTFNVGSANWSGGTLLEGINANSPGTYVFVSTPLNPNTYNVSASFFSWSGAVPSTSDYVFSFQVTAIPEPISLVVFGGLIVGGGLIARKRLIAGKATA